MIKISSAKLTKESTLNVGYIEELIDPETDVKSIKTHPTVKCTLIVHNDLKKIFEDLAGHLGCLCDLEEMKGCHPEEEKNPFGINVLGVTITGDEDLGVVISGSRNINIGRLSIENPSIKFSDGIYPFVSELAERIHSLQEEVILYLNGKTAPTRQLNIFDAAEEFSAAEDLEMSEDGIKPARKSRKLKISGVDVTVSTGKI